MENGHPEVGATNRKREGLDVAQKPSRENRFDKLPGRIKGNAGHQSRTRRETHLSAQPPGALPSLDKKIRSARQQEANGNRTAPPARSIRISV